MHRLDNLLFLLASSSLAIACPADDESGDDALGSASADTAEAPTSGTSGADDATGATTTTGATTATGAVTTAGTAPDDSDDGNGSDSGAGLDPAQVCPAFGAIKARCAPGIGNDYEALCYDSLDYYDSIGLPACVDALLDVYACVSALDCQDAMLATEVSCPREHTAYEAECPAMPPPP